MSATSPWLLDPEITFLNHGSFGSCPRPVLEVQRQWRERLEHQPIQFFVRELEPLLDQTRARLARFLGATADNLVLVPNATAGVNSVLRSLAFQPGDELLVTHHEYNACRNALNYAAERNGATVRVAQVPFPFASAAALMDPILQSINSRTRLALIDHVTSQTGIVLPIQRLARELHSRGIDLLVDGAHAPGMIPLHLDKLGATYYTGNAHKWLCAPKGTGFLYVRPERQCTVRPLAISHGANSPRRDRSRFQIEFGWTGTWDPSAYLSIPTALDWMESQIQGGWPQLMASNRTLALRARTLLCHACDQAVPCPDEFIGSLASIPLPDGSPEAPSSPLYADPLQDLLRTEHHIEVPVIPWPAPPRRLLRISAQIYNVLADYEALARALPAALSRSEPGL